MCGLWFTKRRDFGIVDSVPPETSETFIAAYPKNLVKSVRAINVYSVAARLHILIQTR